MHASLLSLASLMLVSVAAAQTSPSAPSSPGSQPSSSMQNPSTTGTANYSNGTGDSHWQMKSCLAKQKADNPNLTDAEMKRNCEKQKPNNAQ